MLLKKRTERKIVVVTRETRVDNLKKRFNSIDQAAFFVEKRGGNFRDYVAEHDHYRSSMSVLEDTISSWGTVQFIDRIYLPNFVFAPDDTVIAIGQDGLVANTLKYLRQDQPLIGVNPDPDRWDGVLLPFTVENLPEILPEVLAGRHRKRQVTMAGARLNDGQEILAVNDFFVGQRTHTSARYVIKIGGREEAQSSSGVVISTGLGSTGWLKSLLRGASVISARSRGGASPDPPDDGAFPWEEPRLVYTVREPFPSRTTGADLVFGEVTPRQSLSIRSLMAENGVLFSDGIESDYLEFNSGTEATIFVSDIRGHLVVG